MKRHPQKTIVLTTLLLIILSAGACKDDTPPAGSRNPTPLDTTYWIDGRAFELTRGKNETEAAPGSATVITTAVYGPFATGDLNGDDVEDTAVILIHDPGGSGTFYYVAAAINYGGQYMGTHATLLGDRIDPVDIEIENSVIEVTYHDRRPGDPMAAEVSVQKTLRLVLKNDILEAIPSNG